MSKVLIYVEHAHGRILKATQVAMSAATQLAAGGEIVALVCGQGVDGVAQASTTLGASKVLVIDDARVAHSLADVLGKAIAHAARAESVEIVVAAATAVGKDALPRVAQLLGAGMASEIIGINADSSFVRPTYAGNVLATVAISTPVKVVSVRGTAYDPAPAATAAAPISKLDLPAEIVGSMRFVGFEETKSDRPQLADASIVVSGGRGLKSGENFKEVLEPLVDAMGAAMGASRAAVDAGFVPNDLQVGQTGKVVAPQLYVAVGISGAIQHLAGMKDSKIIVAINKDADAPIFSVADYGLVADLFKAVPEMVDAVTKLKAG